MLAARKRLLRVKRCRKPAPACMNLNCIDSFHSLHTVAARRSCHVMRLQSGSPVSRSHSKNEFRWHVIPRHAASLACRPARRSVSDMVVLSCRHNSSGSISEWPGCGCITVTSELCAATCRPSLFSAMQHILVVPTSTPRTKDMVEVP